MASTLHCCIGNMPEHAAAWPKDKAGWEAVYRMALPSLISTTLSINFPDELLTTAVLSSAFCSCSKRNCMPSLLFFPSVVPLQGQMKHFATAASWYFQHGYGPCKDIKLDMQMRGPVLIWYFSTYLPCFQINIFNRVSFLCKKIRALFTGKKMPCWKSDVFGLWLDHSLSRENIKKFNYFLRLFT